MRIEKIKSKTADAYTVPLYWIYDGEELVCMCETKENAQRIVASLNPI